MSDGVIGETTTGCMTAGCTSTVDLRVIHHHSGTPATGATSTNGHEPADPEGLRLVRGNLRALSADLAAAVAANDHDDWAAVLQAVRLIQGRAVVTRGALDGMLGSNEAADLPPLVRVYQEIRPLISDQELGNLSVSELSARMLRIRQVFDRELKVLLSPPDGPSIPDDADGAVRRD